jgi:hypothetical protein
MDKRRASIGGSLFLALFALPFAAVGIFMTGLVWRDVLESRRILNTWQVVPAKVEAAELKTSRTSKGGTTYQATATYAYAYKDSVYRSERVGLSGGFDNIGTYQHKVHRQLKTAQRTGRPVNCLVNPADPAQAVLNATWRPEMGLFHAVFGIVFGGVGLGLLAGGVLSLRLEARKARLKKLNPQEPWLWREEWQSPSLQARLGPGMIAASAVLVWINLATWPLWSVVRTSWADDGAFKWVLSGALALVLVASAFCVRTIIHARKYRGARLDLGALPLSPGASVEARLYLPQALPIGAVLKLALVSERSVSTGRGKQRRTNKTKLWSHEQTDNGPLAPAQEILFRCRLPADAVATSFENPDDVTTWTFTARADVPGVDLNLNFELPVFSGPRAS